MLLLLVSLLIDPYLDLSLVPGYCLCITPWIVHLVPVFLLPDLTLGSVSNNIPGSSYGLLRLDRSPGDDPWFCNCY